MPILAPDESWNYESGTQMETPAGTPRTGFAANLPQGQCYWFPTGSMTGSFQMEVLKWGSGSHGPSASSPALSSSFSAQVGRIALTREGDEVRVPCGNEAPTHLVPTTSVFATQRVIVGASTEHLERSSDPFAGEWEFKYDIQINNARSHPVKFLAHKLYVAFPSRGQPQEPILMEEGAGLGGYTDTGETEIAPGGSTR
jgi:uncharacterized protein affecting Mg2+/Co2+ transport